MLLAPPAPWKKSVSPATGAMLLLQFAGFDQSALPAAPVQKRGPGVGAGGPLIVAEVSVMSLPVPPT